MMPQTARRFPHYRAADGAPDLFTASLHELLRLFYRRDNEALEFSKIRIALEAAGVKARHPQSDWGSLAASLRESKVLEVVGRRMSAAHSRNGAKNSVYRLTETYWNMAIHLAQARGWEKPQAEPMAEQTVLVP